MDTRQPLPSRIGRPATLALRAVGYSRLDQLDGIPARWIEKLHNITPHTVHTLREALATHGGKLR